MTTHAATYQHTAPRFPWLLLFGLVLLAAVIFGAHAVAKHGSEAGGVGLQEGGR